MSRPIIAISMGDAAGIGPELIVKLLSDEATLGIAYPLVVGSPAVFEQITDALGFDCTIHPVSQVSDATFSQGSIDVLQPHGVDVDPVRWGVLDPKLGDAAARCLRHAFELAQRSDVQGVVSAPLNKEAFHLAGYHYADELEFLAKHTESQDPVMFGIANGIWTVMVCEHVAFRRIVDFVKRDRVLHYIRRMHGLLQDASIASPRIAVAALNVHAGEGGLFGREEIDEIAPAIADARTERIDTQGPVPADIVFARALEGDFDGVVFMYHDQANIARKLQPRETGATLFVGLPVPCGTTAHGTAFDKAGQGIADPGSLRAAYRYTALLASEKP